MFVWTFLLRITHTIISQSSADSSWITPYMEHSLNDTVTGRLKYIEKSQSHCHIIHFSSLPGMLSLGMLEWKEIKSQTGSWGVDLFSGLWDLSLSWGSLGRIYVEKWNVGWRNNIWHCGVALVVHRDRPGNWSLALIWLQGLDYCPLTGHNPGLLLACSLDITPWEDIYI